MYFNFKIAFAVFLNKLSEKFLTSFKIVSYM